MHQRIVFLLVGSLIFSLSFPNTSNCQTITFEKQIGRTTESGASVYQTRDGGYIITGTTQTWRYDDVYLVKTNAWGDTLWTKFFGGQFWDGGNSVQQTRDGGYIIAGLIDGGAGSGDIYLVKTDSTGEITWEKQFGGFGSGGGTSVQETLDGSYIVAGYENYRGILIKTNVQGDTLWTRTFDGGAGNLVIINSLRQTSDGGYILTGSLHSNNQADVYLIKTNSLGETTWAKTYSGSGNENAASVALTADEGYIITGGIYTYVSDPINIDILLIKADANGDTVWTKTIDVSGIDQGASIQQCSDGGYILTGATDSKVFLAKMAVNGDILWTKSFGGDDTSFGSEVQQTADGGFIIVGGINSDVYLVKTSADGLVSVEENISQIIPKELQLFQNYPNPFNPNTTIRFALQRPSFVSLKVYNTLGQEIAFLVSENLAAGRYEVDWNASGQASGVYLYRLQAEELVETKKLTIVR